MKSLSEEDWAALETQMAELERELSTNERGFSESQASEVRKLQGRYAALQLKKGVDEFQDALKGLGDQMEGFIEGLKADGTSTDSDEE